MTNILILLRRILPFIFTRKVKIEGKIIVLPRWITKKESKSILEAAEKLHDSIKWE